MRSFAHMPLGISDRNSCMQMLWSHYWIAVKLIQLENIENKNAYWAEIMCLSQRRKPDFYIIKT